MGWGGEAGGEPPSLAAGETCTVGMSNALKNSSPNLNTSCYLKSCSLFSLSMISIFNPLVLKPFFITLR